jgi:hypothetical protein|tara:strand:+ start:591 stop:1079 length:489 start_codon:yes stop_codon:yes gene_type:complete
MTIELAPIRGVANHYGTRTTKNKYGGQESTKMGVVKSAEWHFTYDDLPAALNSNLPQVIPANASIVSATLYVDEAFTSTSTTTDLTVGLEQKDGTDIDIDGLLTAANASQTTIGTAGNVIAGTGALVGVSVGANPGQLIVDKSADDLLTGKARCVVEFAYDK